MSGVSVGNAIRLPRFGGEGSFQAWKLKVLAYLLPLGLKEAVVSDGSPSSDEQKESSRLAQEKAYGILINLLEDRLIDLVVSVEPGNARGVWKVLLETYEAKSTALLCHTLDLFMNIQFRGRDHETESFDMYRARFMNLLQKLKEMGELVSPAIQRYVILKGLPAEYDALRQSLKINDKLTLEEVCTHIKDVYETDKHHPRDYTTVDLNLSDGIPKGFTGYADGHGKKSRGRNDVCYTCGNPGHYSRDCALTKGFKPKVSAVTVDSEEDSGHFFA